MRHPDGIKNIESKILSRANANNVNKRDDMQYSRTHLSGCSKGTEKTVDLDELPT